MTRSANSLLLLVGAAMAAMGVGGRGFAQSTKVKKQRPFKVIVVRPKTNLESQKKVLGPLGLGEVLTVTLEQEGWQWVPSRFGWVKADNTLRVDQAVRVFTKKIREKPTAATYHHRGLSYAAQEKHKQAIDDYTAALKLAPGNTSIFNNRGNSWRSIGSLKNAVKDYDAAIKLDVNSTPAYNNRGMVRMSQGRLTEAIADFKAALTIQPTFADAFNNRGVAYRRQGKLDLAFADYNKAIKWNPRFAAAYANRGFIYKSRKQYDKAITDYGSALRLQPGLVTAHNDVAWLYATCPTKKYRNGKKAVEHARYACEQTRFRDWNMLETLAAAYAEAGQFDQAVTWAREASRRAPKGEREKLATLVERFRSRKALRRE